MNALPIDHVNAYSTGPVSWITKGTVDLDIHLLFPFSDADDDMIDQILTEIDGIRNNASLKFEKIIAQRNIPIKQHSDATFSLKKVRKYGLQYPNLPQNSDQANVTNSDVLIFSKIQFNDLKASIPLTVPELSYMTNALIRPVVAYLNSNRTKIPLSCSIRMDENNFDGADDFYTAGLVYVLSEEVGRSLIALVNNEHERNRRIKEIGLWSVSELSKTIMSVVESARGDRWNSYHTTDN